MKQGWDLLTNAAGAVGNATSNLYGRVFGQPVAQANSIQNTGNALSNTQLSNYQSLPATQRLSNTQLSNYQSAASAAPVAAAPVPVVRLPSKESTGVNPNLFNSTFLAASTPAPPAAERKGSTFGVDPNFFDSTKRSSTAPAPAVPAAPQPANRRAVLDEFSSDDA
jgi:hypothetical protein